MEKLLEVKGLTKKFSGLVALDNATIDIVKGEITSLIGPNGAGKTTFFNCLTGIYKADSGSIIFKGKQLNLKQHVPHEVALMGIARTFQNIRLFANMTVLENVLTSADLRQKCGILSLLSRDKAFKAKEAEALKRSLELLHFVGLSDKIYELAINLAYGEQRKLEIARALASVPELLLLDEPAAGMNTAESKNLVTLMNRIRDKGISIFLIEHDMKLVMSVSNKVFVLNYGKNIASGVPLEIQKNKQVIEAYLGETNNEY